MEAPGSEFLEVNPEVGRREPGLVLALSERVSLLLMDGTVGAGGDLQIPFPGPSVSVFRDAWAISMSPRASHFPYSTHCHLEQKGPFSKTELKNF